MATALEATKEHLKCPLCKNVFEDPKTLTCLHSFCERCINNHIIDTTKGTTKPKAFNCSECQKSTSLSEFHGKNPETWAALLPTNDVLSNILKALKNVEPPSELQCPRHKDQEVEFFCEEHEIFACSLCSTHSHKACRSVPTLADAVAKRKANIGTLSDDLSAQITETEKLLNNRQDQLEMLGSKEDDIKKEIADMRTQFQDFFSQLEMKVLDKIAEIKHKESGLIQLEINKCHDILSSVMDAMKTVTELKEEKNSINLVKTYNCQLERYEERQDSLDKMLEQLTDIKIKYLANRNIEETLYKFKEIGDLSFEKERSALAKPCKEQPSLPLLNGLGSIEEEEVADEPEEHESRDQHVYVVAIDATAPTAKASSSVSVGTEIDEESVEIKETVPTLQLEEETVKDLTPSQGDTMTIVKSRFVREFNTVINRQTECVVAGATILPSGHIVVTDPLNNCLKVFDATYNFVAMAKFSVPPGDVTAVSEKEVVVCVPDTLKLKHEKIDFRSKKITAGEILHVGDKCHSVSYQNQKIACCSKSRVYIYFRQGSAWVQESKVNLYFNNLKFVALDALAKRFVVTRDGYPNQSVICMTISGTKLWSFTHEEIRMPRGIIFYGNKIITAIADQKIVIQIDGKDGRFDGIIVQGGGLQWPWNVCISSKGDKLILSQNDVKMASKDKSKVLVYRIQKVQVAEKDSPVN